MEDLLITLANSVILISKEIKELNQIYQNMNLKIEKVNELYSIIQETQTKIDELTNRVDVITYDMNNTMNQVENNTHYKADLEYVENINQRLQHLEYEQQKTDALRNELSSMYQRYV